VSRKDKRPLLGSRGKKRIWGSLHGIQVSLPLLWDDLTLKKDPRREIVARTDEGVRRDTHSTCLRACPTPVLITGGVLRRIFMERGELRKRGGEQALRKRRIANGRALSPGHDVLAIVQISAEFMHRNLHPLDPCQRGGEAKKGGEWLEGLDDVLAAGRGGDKLNLALQHGVSAGHGGRRGVQTRWSRESATVGVVVCGVFLEGFKFVYG